MGRTQSAPVTDVWSQAPKIVAVAESCHAAHPGPRKKHLDAGPPPPAGGTVDRGIIVRHYRF